MWEESLQASGPVSQWHMTVLSETRRLAQSHRTQEGWASCDGVIMGFPYSSLGPWPDSESSQSSQSEWLQPSLAVSGQKLCQEWPDG